MDDVKGRHIAMTCNGETSGGSLDDRLGNNAAPSARRPQEKIRGTMIDRKEATQTNMPTLREQEDRPVNTARRDERHIPESM